MHSLKSQSRGLLSLLLVLWIPPAAIVFADEVTDMAAKPSTFRTAKIVRGDLVATISTTGTLEPEELVDVGAQVSGHVMGLGVIPGSNGKTIDYGSQVEKGTILARIDDALYAVQVDQARLGCMRAKAEMTQATAALELADVQRKRATDQFKNNSISAGEFDVAAASFKLAQAGVVVVEAAVAQSQANLKQAELNLGYTIIRSPVRGIIIDRRVNVGQTVDGSLNAPSLFLIAKNLAKMQVWASVNEADVGRVRVGQSVRFTIDAYPREVFSGKVDQVRLNAQMTQNVVTYTVVVTTDNPTGKLLPYLTANVQFEVERKKNVLLVSNAALRWRPRPEQISPDVRDRIPSPIPRADDGNGRLWVQDGNSLRPVDVRLGPTDGTKTEVGGSTVEEGMEVIVGENAAAMKTGAGEKTTTREESIRRTLASMGSNLLLVLPGPVRGGVTWGTGSKSTLTAQDAEEIARQCPAVSDAAPVVRGRSQITYGNRNWLTGNITGTTPSFLAARDWTELSEGDIFTDRDVRNAAKVCVIGETLKRELFAGESPLGKEIRVLNVPFRVIGVLSAKGANLMGLDQDDIVLAPWTTIKYHVSSTTAGTTGTATTKQTLRTDAEAVSSPPLETMDQIFVRAISEEQIPRASEQITELLRDRHRIVGKADDFNIRDMSELKKMLSLPRR
ncbi:MAG: efflux RND transporter periplasmic adaptor subunit [Planctomycetota bacterium]